jgi:hypothetical protein
VPELKSLAELDLERSWARVLSWARRRIADVPDRLQYELWDRLWSGGPRLERSHDVQPAHLVLATKGAHQTVRPFVRAHPRDLLLFWALVDAASPVIEGALGPPDTIFANRWTPLDEDVTPSLYPNWSAFEARLESEALEGPYRYVLRTDVTSFYMTVVVERLARVLLEVGVSGPVVSDIRVYLLDGRRKESVVCRKAYQHPARLPTFI